MSHSPSSSIMSIEAPTSLNYLRDLNPPELLPPENTSSPSELSEKRRLVLEILERNTSTLEEIEMHISWLQSSPLDSIRHLETDTPVNQNEFTEYIHRANEFITSYQSVIASQSKIVDIITKKFRRTFLAESSPLAESVLESSDNKHNTEIDKHFIKLPKSVIKYTTSNSRNVNEFLDTFLSDLTIALNDTVEIDGNVFAKYLSTAVDDRYRQKRTDFTSEYFTLATSISPRKLTVDEAKELFRKHFEQHKYAAEPSQRLLSMGMKYDETFEDYATRVEREVKNSGTNNNSPSILKFLQTTLPPVAQTIIQQACIMNHALKRLDVKFGEYKYDDIREWLVECKNIAGKASDYSSPPSFKKLPNSSITFDISSDTTNKKRQTEVQSSNNKGFKKPKLSLDAPSSSSASHATTQSSDKCQKCNLSNHTTADCNAPLCQDCEAYHFPKRCPKRRYRSQGKSNNNNTNNHKVHNNTITITSSSSSVDHSHPYETEITSLDDQYSLLNISNSPYLNCVTMIDNNNNFDNRPTVNVTFKGTIYSALIDTGCTHTFINKNIVDKFNIHFTPAKGTIGLGKNGITVNRIGTTEPITILHDNHSVKCQMEILELPLHDFHISMNTFFEFGFGITGLPNPIITLETGTVTYDETPPLIPSQTPIREQSSTFLKEREKAMLIMQAALTANRNIPLNSFCPLPAMKVHLNVPPNTVVYRKGRPFSKHETLIIDEHVQRWLGEGIIKIAPPGNPHNSPLTLAPKKDSEGNKTNFRVCLDPRLLNTFLPDDHFPLPLISEILNDIAGHEYYSILDLRQAYHRLPIHEPHQPLTAFSHMGKQYMFQRAPFGLKHLSSHFQRGMSHLLGDLPFVRIFIDDIIIFSNSLREHANHLKTVINRLTSVNLILNIDKCHLFKTQICILGYMIDRDGKQIDPHKLSNLHSLEYPTCSKLLQRHLGFFNFFREFIPRFSTLTAPLDELRFATSSFTLNENQKQCYDSLKQFLLNAPILRFPDYSKPLYIATDASNVGIGAVLYQLPQGDKFPNNISYISFMARSLHTSERRYSATKKELLAIVFALQKFHYHIYGRKFTLFTDHRALSYLFSQKEQYILMSGW
jgi:hypothetical protein